MKLNVCLRTHISTYWASQVGSMVKNLPANARDTGDTGLIPRSGRSPGGGNVNSLQYSYLKNPMDRGDWQATAHRVTELDMAEHAYVYRLIYNYWASSSDSDRKESSCNAGTPVKSLRQEDLLEKGMASHSSILSWRIPRT